MLFADILARFESVSEELDGGYLARCPAHGDNHPSLRIWRGDDLKVRFACRAGCATEDVIAAARLKWRDLFDADGPGLTVPRERPQVVGTEHIAALRVWLDSLPMASTEPSAADYAARRFGLTPGDMDAMDLRSSGRSVGGPEFVSAAFRNYPRLVVPLMSFSGVARGAQGRDLSGQCPGRWISLRNPQGHRWAQYGVIRGSGGYGVTLITEGPGDGLTAAAVGYDVVMVRGAALAGSDELVAEIAEGVRGTQVIAAGDADAAGEGFNRKLAEALQRHDIDVYQIEIPRLRKGSDLTDWREDCPEDFPRALHEAVKVAKRIEVGEPVVAEIVPQEEAASAVRVISDAVARYGSSDAMNAHALVAWAGGRIRWAPGLGFYVWNGRHWELSEVKVRQEIHRLGGALVTAGRTKEAEGFTMTKRINYLMTELKAVPSVYTDPAAFDSQPDLLSFRNGTLDLRTGELRPHSPSDLLTTCLDIEYDPDATAPRWERFLEEIFPGEPDLPGYVQRLIGYGITGHASEQAFAVLWGKGANGKTVFTDTLSYVFDAVSRTTPFNTFEDKASGGIPNDIAALRDSRLVMASEGENGRPMSEAVLKRVTGNEKIAARFLRQEFFEFQPQFLLLLATNHKPKFKGQDEGLWRRVKMIPFQRYFAPDERDHGLALRLRREAAGIAAWAVRGAIEWYRNGLQDPDVVRRATSEYKEASNVLAGFLPGVLVPDNSSQLKGAEIYSAYRDWCEAEGLQQKDVLRRNTLYEMLEERGAVKRRASSGMVFTGLRFAETPSANGPGIFARD